MLRLRGGFVGGSSCQSVSGVSISLPDMFRSPAIVLRRWKLFPTFLLILVTILLLAQMVPFETDKTSTDSCLGPVIKIGFAKTHKTASG